MGLAPDTEFPCTIHRFTPAARQPAVHQIDRLVDGAIPVPIENTIRFRSIAATLESQRVSELVCGRATTLRRVAIADVGDDTVFVIPRLDEHELVYLGPRVAA
jgi:hypothetical protein